MSEHQTFVGIDPGASGGIATICNGAVECIPMPQTDRDLWQCLRWLGEENWSVAVIEKVGGYIKGSKGNIGSAMFAFGRSYGALLMALIAAGISHEEVVPRVWQKGLGVPPRKPDEAKAEFKRRLKVRAQQLHPTVDGITLKTCDAVLLATWCQRKHQGAENARQADQA